MPAAALDAEDGKHLLLHLRVVQADRAAADLEAVEHQVVAVALHPGRIAGSSSSTCSSTGRVKAWWAAVQRPVSSSRSNSGGSTTHRKRHWPPLSELGDEAHQLADVEPELGQRGMHHRSLAPLRSR